MPSGAEPRTFGQRLAAWREARDLRQLDLALLADTTQATISRIEKDETKRYEPAVLRRIAKALRIPIPEFMAAAGFLADEDSAAVDEEDEELAELIRMVRADDGFMRDIRAVGGDETEVLRDVVDAMRVHLRALLRQREAARRQ